MPRFSPRPEIGGLPIKALYPVSELARSIGVSRKTLSAIVNGRAGISLEMAIRLSRAFDTTAESWLNQQVQYDLWHAEQNCRKLRIPRLSAA